MKRFMTLVLASMMLGATPVMAADSGGGELPKELKALGLTTEDLKDMDKAVVDDVTSGEANINQRSWRRYCPRGYVLRAYRIRIGRFVIVRYRCVRYSRRYDNNTQQTTNQQINIVDEVEPLIR